MGGRFVVFASVMVLGLAVFVMAAPTGNESCQPVVPGEPVCATALDCEGLPHAQCPGEWACTDVGACEWGCISECDTNCDCAQGEKCHGGICTVALGPGWCCEAAECPLDEVCQYTSGTKDVCRATCGSTAECAVGELCDTTACIGDACAGLCMPVGESVGLQTSQSDCGGDPPGTETVTIDVDYMTMTVAHSDVALDSCLGYGMFMTTLPSGTVVLQESSITDNVPCGTDCLYDIDATYEGLDKGTYDVILVDQKGDTVATETIAVPGCFEEGDSFIEGADGGYECCEGLSKQFQSLYDPDTGTCAEPDCLCYICTACGNGTCDETEDPCICPADCPL